VVYTLTAKSWTDISAKQADVGTPMASLFVNFLKSAVKLEIILC
jgi:hypothetical protein